MKREIKMENNNKTLKWARLENASKIFPATANNKDTKVFRLSCQLKDQVNPIILQEALDITRESFPVYNSVLRRGVFWYYFEYSDIRPIVTEESKPLGSPIYFKHSKNLLYRVFYYNKRISVEMFHALTDGAGVSWFLETLVYHYIRLKYEDDFLGDVPTISYKASISQKMRDSFEKNYRRKDKDRSNPKNKFKFKKAYILKGNRNFENKTKLIEGTISVKEILDLSRSYGTSLTIFLTSLLLYSIYKEMPSKMVDKDVVLSVPINLRQFYQSQTARNFFSTMDIKYNFDKNSPEFKDIIEYVSGAFKDKLTEDKLDTYLDRFMVVEKNPIARIMPLFLKDIALKLVNFFKDMTITSSISNVGQIQMHESFNPYIEKFIVSVSARRPQITMCSFNDKLVISFMSPFEESDVERVFFQELAKQGIGVSISSNM